MFLIGGLTLAVVVAGNAWPAIETTLWMTFVVFLGLILYFDLREPVNYSSLKFDANGFCHIGSGGVLEVAWADVCDVFYTRSFNPFANHIEIGWQFVLKSGAFITVLVECPHKQTFAKAVQKNVDFVSKDKVLAAQNMTGEGRWRCVAE